jgi:transposase
MTAEERIEQLETENTALREQLAAALEQLGQALGRIHELEGQLAKDSHTSLKPPSSDGPKRRQRSQRQKSEKPTGGQPGHAGHSLMQVENPDEVVRHRPRICDQCQQPLEGIVGQVKERRQVHDLPQVRLVVREHQVEEVCCPACQHLSVGSFPAGLEAPVQYGPNLRALGVYLHAYQLVPLGRVSELLCDLYGCQVSEGALAAWVALAAERLAPTVERIADWLSAGPLQHADETGLRIAGQRRWLHVNSTRFLTHLAWHGKRGRQALDAIGIWPRFRGRAMRDRWASYDCYQCAQSSCGAHLVRDCTYVYEQEQQPWAEERDGWVAQYFELLASGFAAQPLPSAEDVPKRGGRRKQSAAKNLLDELALAG